ncbi:muconolactone Delta-isomerase family protein [Corynebacterium halotolerans]|uniref:muconolactone Delta-isomerase family protein n=1 Tax=Corynebacterium halotolerans TaxID=225326 RepID=UPI003CED28FB
MSIFHVLLSEQIPHDMDPEIRADHRDRHRTYLRELREAGVLLHSWRAVGTRDDLAVFRVADSAELHAVLLAAPLFDFLRMEITALVEHPDPERG